MWNQRLQDATLSNTNVFCSIATAFHTCTLSLRHWFLAMLHLAILLVQFLSQQICYKSSCTKHCVTVVHNSKGCIVSAWFSIGELHCIFYSGDECHYMDCKLRTGTWQQDGWCSLLLRDWYVYCCIFHAQWHGNSEVQKPTNDCVFHCRQS